MKKIAALLLLVTLLPIAPIAQAFANTPPESITRFIQIAAEQFDKHGGKKLKKNNEYTTWYYNDQRKIGWCSVFVLWCAHEAEIPLLKIKQIESYLEGNTKPEKLSELDLEPIDAIPDTYVMIEGAVPNARNGYVLTQRLVDIPKPGYQVFYGRIGGAPTLHTGIIETVKDISDGVYEITTLEGNVDSKIKRYCLRYSLNPKKKHHNISTVPADERSVENAQYKPHSSQWYITGFGATW